MSNDDIALRIREIIADRLGRSLDEVVESARFVDDLGADSLDQTEVVMALEEEFNVQVDDDATSIVTVGDAINYIKKRLNPEG